jgi:hypothetical protein
VPDYLDTSAFIKLVRSEPESAALRADMQSGGQIVSSALLVVEGRRAAARYGSLASARAQGALGAVTLLPLDDQTLERAAELAPPELRPPDALHLVTTVSPVEDLQVDNDPVTVALSTPNDPNPTVWVDHAVTVDATATAGPSGVAGMDCSVDGGPASPYPAGGLTVNGNGTHTVSCTASNNAVDPQGNPNTGTATATIKIDEAPPAVSFEPTNPTNPTQLVADTSDDESGVVGGTITMTAPGSSTPVTLPTSFDGSHLIASFDDAGLHGGYTFTATSCDNVGNCASTSEQLALPVRLAATSDISFQPIETPAKIVRKRVLVDFRYKRERRHGKAVRVKVGGHLKRIRIVIPVNTTCTSKRVRVAKHRWREITVCRVLKIRTVTQRHVRFGAKVTVHGIALTAQGAPLAGVPITVETAPDDRGVQYSVVRTVTTSTTGAWSTTLPPGPNRIIHADYLGSATVLPATGQAIASVPAKIRITSITPRDVPWGSKITITGQLDGGYIPSGGALVELHYSDGAASSVYGVRTHVTSKRFTTSFVFGPGGTPVVFGFRLSTLPDPASYPYQPGYSNTVDVHVGSGLPRSSAPPATHHRAKKHHRSRKNRKARN